MAKHKYGKRSLNDGNQPQTHQPDTEANKKTIGGREEQVNTQVHPKVRYKK